MVDRESRHKGHRIVAVLTDISRLHVGQTFTDGSNTVVATNAVSDDVRVIKDGRKPGGRVVAVVALIAGADMVRCFPGRLNAIVAAVTAASNGGMIHERYHCPIRRNVAVRAFTVGGNMAGRF